MMSVCVCVCVCLSVCVCVCVCYCCCCCCCWVAVFHLSMFDKYNENKFCIYDFNKTLSSFQISVLVSG